MGILVNTQGDIEEAISWLEQASGNLHDMQSDLIETGAQRGEQGRMLIAALEAAHIHIEVAKMEMKASIALLAPHSKTEDRHEQEMDSL